MSNQADSSKVIINQFNTFALKFVNLLEKGPLMTLQKVIYRMVYELGTPCLEWIRLQTED